MKTFSREVGLLQTLRRWVHNTFLLVTRDLGPRAYYSGAGDSSHRPAQPVCSALGALVREAQSLKDSSVIFPFRVVRKAGGRTFIFAILPVCKILVLWVSETPVFLSLFNLHFNFFSSTLVLWALGDVSARAGERNQGACCRQAWAPFLFPCLHLPFTVCSSEDLC